MSGGLWLIGAAGFVAGFVGWFVYRWFRPSASQRAMCRMADFYALSGQERTGILNALDRGEMTPREALDRLAQL